VTSERGRGVALYLLSVALLAAGGWWFVRSAPAGPPDSRVQEWRDSAANLLPDRPFQVRSDTIVMRGESSTERNESVGGGSYLLSMICLGDGGRVRVRLSTGGTDSGRAVVCSASPRTVVLAVSLADHFFMAIDAETDQDVAVFRWRLERTRGF
jgi:hypothetical protein